MLGSRLGHGGPRALSHPVHDSDLSSWPRCEPKSPWSRVPAASPLRAQRSPGPSELSAERRESDPELAGRQAQDAQGPRQQPHVKRANPNAADSGQLTPRRPQTPAGFPEPPAKCGGVAPTRRQWVRSRPGWARGKRGPAWERRCAAHGLRASRSRLAPGGGQGSGAIRPGEEKLLWSGPASWGPRLEVSGGHGQAGSLWEGCVPVGERGAAGRGRGASM